MLGRPVSLRGDVRDGSMSFPWPLALPPDGFYRARVGDAVSTIEIRDRGVHMPQVGMIGELVLELLGD